MTQKKRRTLRERRTPPIQKSIIFPASIIFLIVLTLFLTPATDAYVYHDYYGPYGGDQWVDWKETWEGDYWLNNKSHATPPFHPIPTFGGCYIKQEHALLDDLDCDKVPDIQDNCLGLANPEQTDQNQNGIGDACDLVVEKIKIDPPEVMEGRAFTVTATLSNWRALPVKSMTLTVQIPELGLDEKVYVDELKSGERKEYGFYFRLPACVKPKAYDLVLFVAFPTGPAQQESFYIPTRFTVTSSGMCEEDAPLKGKSIINIINIQDIDPEKGGIYPFTIVNNEPYSQAYVLSVEGIEEWGSYQVEPRSLIVVPAGGSKEGALVIYAKKGVSGEHGFLLTLRSKADAQQVQLTARVKPRVPRTSARRYTLFGIFILLAIIIVTGVGIMIQRGAQRRHTG